MSPDPDRDALIDLVRRSVIGDRRRSRRPTGPARRLRRLHGLRPGPEFIEDHLREVVLPLYANTHTETSGTGRQTTRFREDARAVIRGGVRRGRRPRRAVHRDGFHRRDRQAGRILGLRIPHELDERYGLSRRIPADERPVVFIGPYEHHSNELPWRETIADVITIPEDADGHVDLDPRSRPRCVSPRDRPLRIGSFSAASNVTGILTDTRAVSVLLHRYGALAFWDCAAAAPVRRRGHVATASRARRRHEREPPRHQGRRVRLPAQARRRSRHAGVADRARELFTNRSRRCRAAARSPTSTRPNTATSTTSSTARKAARPTSSARSGPAWCSSSSRRSGSTRSNNARSG
jgi:hypothetical protein